MLLLTEGILTVLTLILCHAGEFSCRRFPLGEQISKQQLFAAFLNDVGVPHGGTLAQLPQGRPGQGNVTSPSLSRRKPEPLTRNAGGRGMPVSLSQ